MGLNVCCDLFSYIMAEPANSNSPSEALGPLTKVPLELGLQALERAVADRPGTRHVARRVEPRGVVARSIQRVEGAVAPFEVEGAPEVLAVRWFIDSVLWTGTGSPSGTSLVKGQQVQCEATPIDDAAVGEALLSEAVPVVNSPPSVARVFFEPEVPGADDEV